MAKSRKKYWFLSGYGTGWYPVNFRGIFIILLYFAYLVFMFLRTDFYSLSITDTLTEFLPHLFGATIILLFICYITGEPINLRKLKI